MAHLTPRLPHSSSSSFDLLSNVTEKMVCRGTELSSQYVAPGMEHDCQLGYDILTHKKVPIQPQMSLQSRSVALESAEILQVR